MQEEQEKLSVRQLLRSEKLLREILLFGILFGALILQGWTDFLLLTFPILIFSIAIFVRALEIGQEANYAGMNTPLSTVGLGEKIATRVEFAGILTFLTVMIEGYESLARPQMSAMLAPFFLEILLVTYLLGFYWLFTGIQTEPDYKLPRVLDGAYTTHTSNEDLPLLRLKIASYSTIIVGILFGLGTVFNILTVFQLAPALLISVPGSVLPNGTQISYNGIFLVVVLVAFVAAIIFLATLLKNAKGLNPRIPLETNFVAQSP